MLVISLKCEKFRANMDLIFHNQLNRNVKEISTGTHIFDKDLVAMTFRGMTRNDGRNKFFTRFTSQKADSG